MWGKQKSNILFIDTSTSFAYIAYLEFNGDYFAQIREILFSLKEKKEVFSTLQDELHVEGDAWLYNILNELIQKENIDKINYIALGKGPGSFTSLRVSHSMMRTFSMLRKIKFLAFSSMEFWHRAFALQCNDLFLFRLNQNLYYGYIPQEKPSFLALGRLGWLNFLGEMNRNTEKKRDEKKLNVWLETWKPKRTNPNGSKAEHLWPKEMNELKVSDLNGISADVFTILFDLNPVSWEEVLPEYGHHVI